MYWPRLGERVLIEVLPPGETFAGEVREVGSDHLLTVSVPVTDPEVLLGDPTVRLTFVRKDGLYEASGMLQVVEPGEGEDTANLIVRLGEDAARSTCGRSCGGRAGWPEASSSISRRRTASGSSVSSSASNSRRSGPAEESNPVLRRGRDEVGPEHPDERQVPVQLAVVQSVAHHEDVGDFEAPVADGQGVHDAPGRFVEERADAQAGRVARAEDAQERGRRQAR